MFTMAIHQLSRNCYKYPFLSHLIDKLWFYENWWNEKLFLWNQSINIMYTNEKMCLRCPTMKGMGIIMKIHANLFQQMNFDSIENGRKKNFSYKIKLSISCIPMRKINFCCPIRRRINIITKIHVHLFWQVNFDFTKNSRKKAFPAKPKYQYHVP